METKDAFHTTTVQAISDSIRPQLNIPEVKEWKRINQELQKQK